MDDLAHPIGRYIWAFLIASAAFVIFFAFAQGISYLSYQSLDRHTDLIASSVGQFEDVLANFECDPSLHVEASSRFDLIASKLNLLEKRFGKNDARLVGVKMNYSDLEYRHFLITERFNSECNSNFTSIFFFYSNRNSRIQGQSERMGFILTTLQRTHSNEVIIYSFDADLNSSLIVDLKEEYDIEEVPSIVVNGGEPFVPKDLDELERFLGYE
jgi:hypothetical protein